MDDRLDEICQGHSSLCSVRAQLRERGYLHNPVARFVAGGGTRPGPAQLWTAAWRAWLVVGGLWSAWLSVALVEANSAYLGNIGEGLLLALCVFFPALISSAALMALLSLIIQLAGRRPLPEAAAARFRRVLAVVGGVAFGGFLAAVWLLGRVFTSAPAADWVSVIFLAAGAAIGFLAYRLVALVAGLYLGGSWKARRRLRSLLLLGGSVAVLALVVVLVNVGAGGPAPELKLADTPPVVAVAVDCLDPDDLDPSRVPHLYEQRGRSRVYTLDFPTASSPAEVWATLATGQPPDRHGVRELASLRLAGIRSPLQLRGGELGFSGYLEAVWTALGLAERVPVTSRDWREPPVWDLISRSTGPDNRVAVFNWWATYPAVGREGLFIFTDVAQQATARGETPPPDSIYASDSGADSPVGTPRLTLQLFNGRERARRLGAQEPPLEAVDRAFAGLMENWADLASTADAPVEPTVFVVLRPESGARGEVWFSSPDPSLESVFGSDSVTLYEAAALFFHLCGLPLALDLPGATTSPAGWPRVATYGDYNLKAVTLEELDPALENLRSLGYLQ